MAITPFPGNRNSKGYIDRLRPQHADKLHSAGITDEVAEARGYRSIVTPEELTILGFTPKQIADPNGMLIPLYNYLGGNESHMFRPDTPRLNPNGKPIKYESVPGRPPILDVNPLLIKWGWLHDITKPIIITEGSIKADAGISRGLCCVSISGVNNWRGKDTHAVPTMLAAFEHIALQSRRTVIAFDSDAKDNYNVYSAMIRLGRGLKGIQAVPNFAILPNKENGDKNGLDDYLADHTVDDFWQTVQNSPTPKPKQHDRVVPINGYELNDRGNAERFAAKYEEMVRYVTVWNRWYIWNGTYWKADTVQQINDLVDALIDDMQQEANKLTDNKEREALKKHAYRTGNLARLTAVHKTAESIGKLGANPEQFDRHPYLIATKSGIVDLETGGSYPSEPKHFISNYIPWRYRPNAHSDDWDLFITLVSNHDPEVAEYLQRVAGYCLTGSTKESGIFYLYGPTRTGKTTFVQALKDTFGTYAHKTTFDTLIATNRSGGAARPELAALEGKRLVIASEVAHGKRFDEQVLKEITAGDDVTARRLYADNHTFTPELKLFLAANDVPFLRHDDSGSWARLHVTPFDNPELADRKYLNLKQRILDKNNEEVHEAILAWAIKGTLKWIEFDDLAYPQSTKTMTQILREQNDPLFDWAQEHLIPDKDGKETLADAYESYTQFYFDDRSTRLLGKKQFAKQLEARGYRKAYGMQGSYFTGFRIQTYRTD